MNLRLSIEVWDYMVDAYCHDSWTGCGVINPNITLKTIPDSRACLWFDQPEKVDAAVEVFLASTR